MKAIRSFTIITILLMLMGSALFICNAEDDNIIASGKCGEDVYWSIDYSEKMIIWGTGPMYDYSTSGDNPSPWYDRYTVNEVVIRDGVTSIGDAAFRYMNSLKQLTIGRSVKRIGEFAFEETSLYNVMIPGNVETIEECAFFRCFNNQNKQNVTLSEGLKYIGPSAFDGGASRHLCSPLPSTLTYIGRLGLSVDNSTLTIPGSLEKIGRQAFYGSQMKTLVIMDGVTEIGVNAFGSCTQLNKVILPKSVKKIGKSAFDHCIRLQNFKIPSTITTIPEDAFMDCTSLKSIVIPGNIKTIDSGAFYNCKKLKSVTIKKGVKNIRDHAFAGCTGLKTLKLPSSVKSIGSFAFYYSKVKTITVKTRKLTMKSVHDSLRYSKVKTIRVSLGSKSLNRKYVKKYKRFFAKSNSGRKVKVK